MFSLLTEGVNAVGLCLEMIKNCQRRTLGSGVQNLKLTFDATVYHRRPIALTLDVIKRSQMLALSSLLVDPSDLEVDVF